jgi:hypothetical protein
MQIFVMVFFIGLFLLGADIAFFKSLVPDAPLKVFLAAIGDMILSVVLLVFVARQIILNRPPIAVTDRGVRLCFTDFRVKTVFIPWNKIIGITTGEYRVQMVYKTKHMILQVEPGFPLPKHGGGMLNLAPNELSVELNHLSRKPEEIVEEVKNYQRQFSK